MSSRGGFVSVAYGGRSFAQPDYLGLRPSILNNTWEVQRDRVPSGVQSSPDSLVPPILGIDVPQSNQTDDERKKFGSAGAADPPNDPPPVNIIEYLTLWSVVMVGLVMVDYLYLHK